MSRAASVYPGHCGARCPKKMYCSVSQLLPAHYRSHIQERLHDWAGLVHHLRSSILIHHLRPWYLLPYPLNRRSPFANYLLICYLYLSMKLHDFDHVLYYYLDHIGYDLSEIFWRSCSQVHQMVFASKMDCRGPGDPADSIAEDSPNFKGSTPSGLDPQTSPARAWPWLPKSRLVTTLSIYLLY